MSIGRIASIAKIFVDEGLGFLTHRPHEVPIAAGGEMAVGAEAPALPDREVAKRLRHALERLGPTFVKFGQLLATRVDLFSEDFIDELGKLHSSVAPFPHATALAIIERELDRPIAEVFAAFPTAPVASASVAQVYKAQLRDGRWVAVKVQRPDLEQTLVSDLEILVQMSGWLDALVPRYRKSMIHVVTQEYAQRARMEINFVAEAAAIERFQEFMTAEPFFRVPYVVREITTERLIVMEWLDGAKLDEVRTGEELAARGFDAADLCRNLLRLQVCMSYEYGFIHGDTHPGNLILMAAGKVGLIDFGLHASVAKALRDKMVEALRYQSSGQMDRLAETLVEIAPPADMGKIDQYKADLKIAMVSMKLEGRLDESKISSQLIAGIRVGSKYKNRAQSDLLMVIRNLAIIEGIVLRFYPAMRPNEELKEIIAGILRRRFSPESLKAQLGPLLADLAMAVSRRPETVERLLRLERRFVEAPDLGEFLRREGVLGTPVPPRSNRLVVAVALIIGVVAGAWAWSQWGWAL